jgi:parvulin-like peptidyl-prolyl isomerase
LDTANALLERILAGESFEQLAFEYSTDQSATRNKGDLGFFLWGNMVGEFQEAAFALEPGEVSAPVKTQYGYHLIKLVDKQPNEARGDFESTKSELKEQLLSMKRRIEGQAFMEVVSEKYKVTVDVNTIEYVTHKREMLYPPQVLERLPKSDFDTEQLDRDEQQLPMATWDGGQMTLMEYLVALQEVPQQIRPALDDVDSLATIIFRMKTNDFLVSEAYQLGLENDPEFQRKVRLFKELNMAAAMRDDSLPQPLPPDEAAIRQFYEEHKDQFVDSAQVHVHEILLSDEMLANRLAKEIKTFEEFKTRAMELTERPAKRGTNGDLGYIQQRWFPEIFELAVRTDVGKVGGPVVNAGNRYSIFWVVDRVAEVRF